MKRAVDALTHATFDVLVVGGGIYGLTIAYDAAQRGLSVALIERDDFGSGASFNHLRTIHGGLRYLQTLDVQRARESVRERRTLACIAPEGVRPLAFVLPLTRSLTRGVAAMRVGLLLDRLIAFDRNRQVGPDHQLPPGFALSGPEAVRRFPDLNRAGLAGAVVWHDYVTVEADRLTFAFARAADTAGAVLANHLEATALLVDSNRVVGVRATDGPTGRSLEIGARVTINATGGAVDRLIAPVVRLPKTPLLKAMNLVTSHPARDVALGGRAPAGRHFFMVPWHGRAVFGTWESPSLCDPADAGVAEGEVVSFLGELNQAFPSVGLRLSDVTLVHRGLVPARLKADGRVGLQRDEYVRDHAADGTEGLVSIAGSKYTTARAAAARLVDRVLQKLQRPAVPCRTAVTPLPSIGTGDLVEAVRQEMAITLADALIRRTSLGALGYPGDPQVDHFAAAVAAELGWSADKTRAEIAAVRAFYEWDTKPVVATR